jgi:ABC-type lipoprotein export system ATPase subunit
MELLHDAKQREGWAVMIVSHDIRIKRNADRVLEMEGPPVNLGI